MCRVEDEWDGAHGHPWATDVSAILPFWFTFYFQEYKYSQTKTTRFTRSSGKRRFGISQSSETMFKSKKITTQMYIMTFHLKRGQRSLCVQLRTGTPLAVEVGRYKEQWILLIWCRLEEPSVRQIQLKNPGLFWLSEGDILSSGVMCVRNCISCLVCSGVPATFY